MIEADCRAPRSSEPPVSTIFKVTIIALPSFTRLFTHILFMPSIEICEWCRRDFPNKAARSQHIRKSPECTKKRLRAFNRLARATTIDKSHRQTLGGSAHSSIHHTDLQNMNGELRSAQPTSNGSIPSSPMLGPASPPSDTVLDTTHAHDTNAQAPLRQAHVEDVPDIDDARRFIEPFPDKK